MNRMRALMLPLLVWLVTDLAWAASPADLDSTEGRVAVSGSYAVDFTVEGPIPAGTAILCKARIAPSLPSFQNREMAPVESAMNVGRVTGNAVHCSVQIPFSWEVGDWGAGVALNYEIDAVSAGGAMRAGERVQRQIGVGYPPAGGSASVLIRIRL